MELDILLHVATMVLVGFVWFKLDERFNEQSEPQNEAVSENNEKGEVTVLDEVKEQQMARIELADNENRDMSMEELLQDDYDMGDKL